MTRVAPRRLALEWLHDNIAAFGGNPDLITVFGQSAGAMSIGAQLASPAFKGLYKHAILESEPFGIPFRDADTWTGFAKDFAKVRAPAVCVCVCVCDWLSSLPLLTPSCFAGVRL